MIACTVLLNCSKMVRFADDILRSLNQRDYNDFATAVKQMAIIYRSNMQERYYRLSKGGGEWPDLEPETIAHRRKGGSKKGGNDTGSVAILIDTATLVSALDPVFGAGQGQLQEMIEDGIRVGINDTPHPDSKATIGEIATFHQFGMGNNPERKILVDPSAAVNERMGACVQSAFDKVIDRHKQA
jgi:hypothetical protein